MADFRSRKKIYSKELGSVWPGIHHLEKENHVKNRTLNATIHIHKALGHSKSWQVKLMEFIISVIQKNPFKLME